MAKSREATNPDDPNPKPDQPSVMELCRDDVDIDTFICNWDYRDKQFARLLFLADVPNDVKGDDLAGVTINVQYWICTKIQIPDRQSGQMIAVVRSVLIGPADEIVSTLSHGILKSISKMQKQFGQEPYVPPIGMVVKGVSTGTGSDMLMLIPTALEIKK